MTRAVKLVDEAAPVDFPFCVGLALRCVGIILGLEFGLDEAPVQVADSRSEDVETRAEVVIVYVEDGGDGRQLVPVYFRVAPEERRRGCCADFLDDPDACELVVRLSAYEPETSKPALREDQLTHGSFVSFDNGTHGS